MQLEAQLLAENSRSNAELIADWVGADTRRFAQLLSLFAAGEYRIVQRAAAVISLCAEQHLELVAPHIRVMLARCRDKGIPVAVKRNVMRILQFVPVPDDCTELTLDIGFTLLQDPEETIAVRAFSMTVLEQVSRPYPEIRSELQAVINHALEYEDTSAGFRNRAQKTLALLSRKK
jgi:hypothetical protein